jgi:hypothetical protein
MNQNAGGGSLKWSQHNILGRHFELSDESENIQGKLDFVNVLGYQAVGECGSKRYDFEFTGILRPTIRMINELGETVATVRLRWKMHLKAEIDLANGNRYRMFSFGIIGRDWKLRDEGGRELCILAEKWGVLRSSGVFTLSEAGGADPKPAFLALLMWYIILMIEYQESAVTAGGAT